jgi:dihydroxyacid dehydratase/phosphogluconate dehydratase
VPAAELAARQSSHGEPALSKSTGYLSIYRRVVQPMSTGAVLIAPDARPKVK